MKYYRYSNEKNILIFYSYDEKEKIIIEFSKFEICRIEGRLKTSDLFEITKEHFEQARREILAKIFGEELISIK